MSNPRFKKLVEYLRPHWRQLLLGTIALLIVNGLGIYIPLLIRDSIDRLSNSSLTSQQLTSSVIFIFVLVSIMWGIRMLSRTSIFGIGRQVEFELKQRIFKHLLTLEPAYFANNTIGDLMNRATSDVDSIRRLVGFAILSIINTVFAYGLTLPVMLAIDVPISLLTVSVYPLMLLVVQLFSGQIRDRQLEVQERLSDLSESVQEGLSGIALIKIYAQEEQERLAFRNKNQLLFKANLGLARIRTILFPLVEAMSYLSLLVLLWIGTAAIERGQISVGDLIALIIYIERLVFPTALLGFTITTYQRGEVSIDRVEAILTNKPKIQDAENAISLPPKEVRGEIKVDRLTYTYPNATKPSLDNVTFTIKAGETIAIVGTIGSGKSTLANAIPRLLDISAGQIYLDGCDITQINLQDLRRAVACVPQESFLFSTSIENNIRYGEPTSLRSQVEIVAKTAQIEPEILNFPKQYETIVGERGITLSGGQRQRTSLARALLIDAPILILDDALSSVDNQTATAILNNLSDERGKTVIFITHQLSAAATADRILVMDDGRLVQVGTHAELVSQEGLYQQLWQQHQLKEILN
jgi:ATP-binding cassette, subfamily B, multidrug efflux pump